MADEKLAKLISAQKSLSEWFTDIKHDDAAQIRQEDNDKRERLKVLHGIIGLPYDVPTQFLASDMTLENRKFGTYLEEHGEELCALRLMPIEKSSLPKLRIRGKTISDAFTWFKEQSIDAAKYRADFVPHTEVSNWGTIFIVNNQGIFGEIIAGGHHQLTQGFHDDEGPHVFSYDFNTWSISPKNDAALKHLQETIPLINVANSDKQSQLKEELDVEFAHDYIKGYFETSDSVNGTWYIDYNKSLGKLYADFNLDADLAEGNNILVSGRVGASGEAEGMICIVDPQDVEKDFEEGSILVCSVTTPHYVPLMKKAAAIVTDQGGILSHAAIVARELGVPCIVGTQDATTVLKNGDKVKVDATNGAVYSC